MHFEIKKHKYSKEFLYCKILCEHENGTVDVQCHNQEIRKKVRWGDVVQLKRQISILSSFSDVDNWGQNSPESNIFFSTIFVIYCKIVLSYFPLLI